jgi:L-fucose mutarotase/ribose pyranase (RbsD/FucU family)
MHRKTILKAKIWGLGVALALTVCLARAAEMSPLDQLRERIAALAEAPLSAGQSTEEVTRYSKKLSFILSDPAFNRLTGKEQHDALFAAAVVALRLGNNEEALKRIIAVSEMPEGNGKDWEVRCRIALLQSDRPQVKTSLLTLARKYPETLRQIDPTFVLRATGVVLADKSEDMVALLIPMFDGQYRVYGAQEPSEMWGQLAQELLKRGDLQGGQRVAARITAPEILIRLSSELSKEKLLEANPYRADPRAALAKELETEQELWRQHPRSGYVLQDLLRDLNRAGRFQQAVDASDGALEKIRAKDPAAPEFDDHNSLNWFYDFRSTAYQGLGKWDDGVRALEEGSRQPEQTGPNVSQVLNLASLYCSLGRAQDIRATIQRMGKASAYGDGVRLAAEHCAAMLDGDLKKAAKVLARLDFARSSAPTELMDALIQSNDLDAAASVLIETLENDRWRSSLLRRIQEYETGAAETQLDTLWQARRKQMYERADVAAAIRKYGYARSYDLRQ